MRRVDPWLLALLSVFLVLAVLYSVTIPLFEGPDEDDHFRYVKYLADHRGLPVQAFQPGGGEAGHQGWQPPLYYALAALVIAPVDTSDFQKRLWRNPVASYTGDISCCGRNLYFHTDEENFPYRNTTLAVHLARGLTIAFGLLTAYALYALALVLFPANRLLPLAATAVGVLNPSFLYASALVSNDVPLAALCTLALWLMAKLVTGALPATLRHFFLLGMVIALALLIKTTALGLVPFAVIAAIYVAFQARARHSFARIALVSSLAILIPIILLTGWWFVRNQQVYGDPLAYRLIYASAIFPRDSPLTIPELFQISLPWLWQTFWGGPTPGDFPQPILFALLVLAVLGALGSLLYVTRQWKALEGARHVMLGVLLGWLCFIVAAQLMFIRTSGGTDQGRYLFPAVASISIFLVLGWNELAQRAADLFRRPSASSLTWVNLTIFGAMTALPLYALFSLTIPAFAVPPPVDPLQIKARAAEVDANFGNQVALRGYALSATTLSCQDTLGVTLFWNALDRMSENYRVFAHLVNSFGAVAGGRDVIPYRGAYSTVLWKPGQWVEDTIYVPINTGARAGSYTVIVGLYPFGQPDNRVNLANSDRDFVALGEVQLDAPAEGCP